MKHFQSQRIGGDDLGRRAGEGFFPWISALFRMHGRAGKKLARFLHIGKQMQQGLCGSRLQDLLCGKDRLEKGEQYAS